jgi:FKBP-type peptidyl-prolyl cis-trans isomerase SlpA
MPDGQTLTGHILEIGDTEVRVDFNHPLAGLSIEFEVEIADILSSATTGDET